MQDHSNGFVSWLKRRVPRSKTWFPVLSQRDRPGPTLSTKPKK
jgi:hypothetical protein